MARQCRKRRRSRLGRGGSLGCTACRTFSGHRAHQNFADQDSTMPADDFLDDLLLPGNMRLAALGSRPPVPQNFLDLVSEHQYTRGAHAHGHARGHKERFSEPQLTATPTMWRVRTRLTRRGGVVLSAPRSHPRSAEVDARRCGGAGVAGDFGCRARVHARIDHRAYQPAAHLTYGWGRLRITSPADSRRSTPLPACSSRAARIMTR
jgi:hypothetical protein